MVFYSNLDMDIFYNVELIYIIIFFRISVFLMILNFENIFKGFNF